jgi:adenosylmethionine-8-amino-7-oxononanoate aminotransferase
MRRPVGSERIWAPSVDGGKYDSEMHVTLDTGDGMWANTSDGRRLLDANSGLWHLSLGYAPAEAAEAGAQALRRLGGTSLLRRSHSGLPLLVGSLAQLLAPMDAVFFFATSGSEAVDAALRIAFADGLRDTRSTVAFLSGAYHGASWAPLTLSNSPRYRRGAPSGFQAIELPSPTEWAANPLECAAAIKSIFGTHGRTLAAVIAEPIQCVGGMVRVPREYLELLARMATEHSALLIMDEVSTGVFRTGMFVASTVPSQMVILGKGLTGGLSPMSVVAVDRRLADRVRESNPVHRLPGSTQAGDPIGCACSTAVLQRLTAPAAVDLRHRVSLRLRTELEKLVDIASVESVSGPGHLWGIKVRQEVVGDGPGFIRRASAVGLANDLLIHPLSAGVIPVMPALIMEEDEVGELVGRVRSTLERLFI